MLQYSENYVYVCVWLYQQTHVRIDTYSCKNKEFSISKPERVKFKY